MLDELFLQVLDMSRTASIVIVIVILARLLLKKAPKIVSYALWAVVLFRLLCPLSVEAPVSIVPELTPAARYYNLANEPISIAGAGVAAYRAVGDALNGGLGIQYIPTTETNENGSVRYVTSDWWNVWILFGQYVWIAGVAVMILRGVISYGKLRRKLRIAVLLWENIDNICIADDIGSPLAVGLLHPKIYLPCGLSEQEEEYIIRHEEHHIKRFDHIWKMLAFLALCIHWFNPLVWLAFVLAGKDMEMSCDEAVVREMGSEIRAEYSTSLLKLATGRRMIAGTPLAFGEGNAKARIQNLGKWKQPALWIVAAAAAAGILLTVCLAANPIDEWNNLHQISGMVTELQTGDNGDLTAIIIRTNGGKETGILLTEDTTAFPPGGYSGTASGLRAAFQEVLQPDMMISAACARGKKTLTKDSGERITAYKACFIHITGQLNRSAAVTRDGTRLNVVEDDSEKRRVYQLEDGTELLCVCFPNGRMYTHVAGTASFNDLSESAQQQVDAFYEQRGILYVEQEELEKVYALYRELGADFCSGMVEQIISPSASNDRVIYFSTSVTLPVGRGNGNVCYEIHLCDAFDRETGAHIDTWDLFTAPEETVMETLLDECGITDQPRRAEMEAVSWDGRIIFSGDSLSVMFEPGTLPSESNATGFVLDYTPAVLDLMQDWAVPKNYD